MFKQYEQFNISAIKCFALEHLSVLAKDCFSKRSIWHFGHFWQKRFGDSLLARARQHVFQQSSVLARVFQQVLASFSTFQQERLSKCFSKRQFQHLGVLTQAFQHKPFQHLDVLANWCFSIRAFLHMSVLEYGCFSSGAFLATVNISAFFKGAFQIELLNVLEVKY